ncbi:protein-S-isoprenylcysteine O-methyltransferase Ste14 [Geothermobacter ehrlichii]|uniref:Protein-S-isoprenylcysteine O-methyltransferase Ste14 n=1 Tax=Geothermobacter ehrlichii TaxID=213224 RepID=A0A5D3WMX3_9BACT|nr:methyltransferase [Geothermobacter ehrlichii]TYO98940.1 protein-S-isoprenylcysteine O-methyltransferase Ste14 [Geothermobacter ehrlichii]
MNVRARVVRRSRVRAAVFYWLVLPGLVVVVGLLLDRLFGWRAWPWSLSVLIAAVLLVIGGSLLVQRATADFAFYGQGTPAPQDPPKRLVTDGVYAWCRHPMWLGYDLAALGVVLLWRSPAMLLICYPLFLLLQLRFLLRREEPRLLRRFGAEYQRYRQQVPLLLPRPGRGKEKG